MYDVSSSQTLIGVFKILRYMDMKETVHPPLLMQKSLTLHTLSIFIFKCENFLLLYEPCTFQFKLACQK